MIQKMTQWSCMLSVYALNYNGKQVPVVFQSRTITNFQSEHVKVSRLIKADVRISVSKLLSHADFVIHRWTSICHVLYTSSYRIAVRKRKAKCDLAGMQPEYAWLHGHTARLLYVVSVVFVELILLSIRDPRWVTCMILSRAVFIFAPRSGRQRRQHGVGLAWEKLFVFLDGSGNSTNQLRLIVCSHFLPLLTDGFGDRSHVIKTCPQFQAPLGRCLWRARHPQRDVRVIGLVHAKSPIFIIAKVIVDAWEKRKAQVINGIYIWYIFYSSIVVSFISVYDLSHV